MEAKDRAKELVDKFRQEFSWVEKDYPIDLYRDTRQCALICCEEIISALKKNNPEYLKNTYWHPIDFYKQVLEEINKL